MSLTYKQRGVLFGMAGGLAISLGILVFGSSLNPFGYDAILTRLRAVEISIQWLLLPTATLVFAVGRLAKHRFFNQEDIDGGGGLSRDSNRAQYLQTLLQNTLEQLLIAALVYIGWAVSMPINWLSVVAMAAISFTAGRILFFIGYQGGAPARALGFAMTFYPSALMMLCMLLTIAWRLAS